MRREGPRARRTPQDKLATSQRKRDISLVGAVRLELTSYPVPKTGRVPLPNAPICKPSLRLSRYFFTSQFVQHTVCTNLTLRRRLNRTLISGSLCPKTSMSSWSGGARQETRTLKTLRSQRPQRCAFANFANRAYKNAVSIKMNTRTVRRESNPHHHKCLPELPLRAYSPF